ncbi:hypothetical protein JCM8202_001174 [Rhodotorula sphaerocarpa]
MATHSLFFYGTLCHAGVLHRVIGHPGADLTLRDAVLYDHVRLHVAGEDYPAVIPAESCASHHWDAIRTHAAHKDRVQVQGVLVEGLTADDVAMLDEFEGDEYERRPCTVYPLPDPAQPGPEPQPLPASVYTWTAGVSRLEPRVWSFAEFLRDSSHRWVGVEADQNPDYAEVDRRRNMNGVITPRT